MKRALWQLLPGLRAIYGLTWPEIAAMPYDELVEYVNQFEHWTSILSSGAYEEKRRG